VAGQLVRRSASPVYPIASGADADGGLPSSLAYASDILAILSLYYKTDLNAVAGITLLLTTQLIGFGMSGLLQELLVKRASFLSLL
jgi:hypothetical protein